VKINLIRKLPHHTKVAGTLYYATSTVTEFGLAFKITLASCRVHAEHNKD